nr:MAG TPA: hypothetical protein [Herelleviridae sp.]
MTGQGVVPCPVFMFIKYFYKNFCKRSLLFQKEGV